MYVCCGGRGEGGFEEVGVPVYMPDHPQQLIGLLAYVPGKVILPGYCTPESVPRCKRLSGAIPWELNLWKFAKLRPFHKLMR